MPDLSYEQKHNNYKYVIGVDEVGRGPWAGPVVACACVILKGTELPDTITDSKKLTDKKRQVLSKILIEKTPYCLGSVEAEQIDELNILQATFVAMKKAVEGLAEKLGISADEYFVLVDGNKIPPFEAFKNAESIVKGDSISLTIAAGSIIAKVYRDNLMAEYAEQFPYYAWERNAGYGTKAHQEGLKEHGVTHLHRKSFKPIAALLNQN
ncbi:MAG TPA: ribonuclease HII [Alphaproteobacteria bacterium]|nr:ribonuclease HII [Alphaproteobacteria bacterium]